MGTTAEILADAVKLHQAGNYAEAEKLYCQILQANPYQAEALHLLGVLAHQVGHDAVAVDYIERALALRPNLTEAYYNLGVVLLAQGKPEQAAARHREALRRKPDYAEAHNCLGIALKEMGQRQEAVACYQRALQLQPNLAQAHNNLGNILMDQDRLDEAIERIRHALTLNPKFFEAYNNLGNGLQRMGKPAEAIANYEQAIRVKADYGEAHWNKSLALLLQGDFAEGWREYEWRWKSKGFTERALGQPLWDGSALHGRTILLHAEQGLGDTLQFVRYVPWVKERGGRVVFECPKALLRLLAGFEGIDQMVAAGSALPRYDVQAPLMSLPGIFGTNLANLPAKTPYLSAQQRLIEHWRKELRALSGFKIGIAWKGSAANKGDVRRSIPLAQFAPLARVPGVHLLSLQKGPGAEQLAENADRLTVIDLGDRLDEANGPFMDTAAVMLNLDLVVTADTATAHLAGALGVPVWIALPFMPDWRWLLGRDDSPWYPTARLFRQPRLGDWTDVFERMTAEVAKLVGAHRPPTPQPRRAPAIKVEIAPGEVLDKITILQIKAARITDAVSLQNVRTELAKLEAAWTFAIAASPPLDALAAELKAVNERIWEVENALRHCERQQEFGQEFLASARARYDANELRVALKRRIDEHLRMRSADERPDAGCSED